MAQFAIAAAAATAVSAVASSQATASSGYAAKAEADLSAKMEGIKAREEAIQRRERLIQALAQQNAQVGASGAGGMSSTNVAQVDLEEYRKEDTKAATLSLYKQDYQRKSGSFQRDVAKSQAGISLLQSGAKMYGTYGQN